MRLRLHSPTLRYSLPLAPWIVRRGIVPLWQCGRTIRFVTGLRAESQRREYSAATTTSPHFFNDAEWQNELRTRLLNCQLPAYASPWDDAEVARLAETLDGAVPDPLQTARLVYYHQILGHARVPTRQLLPDGTDTLHDPGYPYVRRVWAGGSLVWKAHVDMKATPGRQIQCRERIKDVQFRAGRNEGDEKVVVVIERVFSSGTVEDLAVEERTLVFMRARSDEDKKAYARGEFERVRYLAPPKGQPDAAHAFVPNAALLARWSALTWNAHAIHLDSAYARLVEGYPERLVHGPLCLTLLVGLVSNTHVRSIEYRNLAPLFCNEQLVVCRRLKTQNTETGQSSYDVWIEKPGPGGGMAVMATVKTSGAPGNSGSTAVASFNPAINNGYAAGSAPSLGRRNYSTSAFPRSSSASDRWYPGGPTDTKSDAAQREASRRAEARRLLQYYKKHPQNLEYSPMTTVSAPNKFRPHSQSPRQSNSPKPSHPPPFSSQQPDALSCLESSSEHQPILTRKRRRRLRAIALGLEPPAWQRPPPPLDEAGKPIQTPIRRVEAPPRPLKPVMAPLQQELAQRLLVLPKQRKSKLRPGDEGKNEDAALRYQSPVRYYRTDRAHDAWKCDPANTRFAHVGVRKIEKAAIRFVGTDGDWEGVARKMAREHARIRKRRERARAELRAEMGVGEAKGRAETWIGEAKGRAAEVVEEVGRLLDEGRRELEWVRMMDVYRKAGVLG